VPYDDVEKAAEHPVGRQLQAVLTASNRRLQDSSAILTSSRIALAQARRLLMDGRQRIQRRRETNAVVKSYRTGSSDLSK